MIYRTVATGIKKALVNSRALRLASRFTSSRAVILMYHSVQDEPERYATSIGSGIIHSTSVFETHMQIVAQRFNPVTLDDIFLYLSEARPLPSRAVAVTFDDGFADNFHTAAPVLSRIGIRASFYLTVSLIGTLNLPWYSRIRHAFGNTQKREWQDPAGERVWRLASAADRDLARQVAWGYCARTPSHARDEAVAAIERQLEVEPLMTPNNPLMMSWDEARRLHQAGHIIGSHTLTHPNVAHVGDKEAQTELLESKRILEKELGAPVIHFSYPHPALDPQWNEMTAAICKRVGYQTAVTTDPGPVRARTVPLALPRTFTPSSEYDFRWNLESTLVGRRM
jgi:peptidoglycan/xylan/chitin deacetylase (PgdA/CDA1 family)